MQRRGRSLLKFLVADFGPEVGLLETQPKIAANKFFQKFLRQPETSHETTQLWTFFHNIPSPSVARGRRVWTGFPGFWCSLSGVKTKKIIVFLGTDLNVYV